MNCSPDENYHHTNAILKASILILLTVSGCAASPCHHDSWFGTDKLYHLTASGAIGAGTTAVVRNNGSSGSEAPLIGVSVAIGAGTCKELYDVKVKETHFSWKDMVWNVIGGTAGSYVVSAYK